MQNNKKNIHVAIIGGGLAGMSAAVALADKGISATIFEASLQLGGRARSINVEFNSEIVKVDNGQHILLGAYRETLKLLAKVGVPENVAFMRLPLTLEMISQTGLLDFRLSVPKFLPHPLNHLFGFLLSYGLRYRECFSVIKLIIILKRNKYQLARDLPLSEFLAQKKQPEKVIKLLWEPLCLAALNTPINIASTQIFLNVLNETFNQAKKSSDFLIAKVDLSQIFALPITRYLESKNVKILLNHRVKSVSFSNSTANPTGYQIVAKTGNSKTEHAFTHVILANSPIRLNNLINNFPKLNETKTQVERYHYQPIYTIYLQYASKITLDKPMFSLTNTLSQWVFDRGILCDQKGLMAVVISAEGKHQHLTHEALALRVAQELHHAFPHLTKPLWHKVIAEKRATFSCSVNLLRPTTKTPYPNLLMAGDYTYAAYPSTIEGAVRSGIECAAIIY